jgi:hypothetical protein
MMFSRKNPGPTENLKEQSGRACFDVAIVSTKNVLRKKNRIFFELGLSGKILGLQSIRFHAMRGTRTEQFRADSAGCSGLLSCGTILALLLVSRRFA